MCLEFLRVFFFQALSVLRVFKSVLLEFGMFLELFRLYG